MGSLFEELKRRNVFKVGAAYAVIAFVLAQVAQLALETFGTPDWVLQTIVLLLGLGFPIALVLAWAYELTPGGIKSDAAVQPAQTSTNSTDRKLIYAILGLVLLVAGIQLSNQFLSDNNIPVNRSAESARVTTNPAVMRASIILNQSFPGLGPIVGPIGGTLLELAPDGSSLAYAVIDQGYWMLRNLATQRTQVLEETIRNGKAKFSPNSQNLLLASATPPAVGVLSVQGGSFQPLPIENALTATWLSDEHVIYQHVDGDTRIFSLENRTEDIIPSLDVADGYYVFNSLPSGTAFLYRQEFSADRLGRSIIQAYDLNSQSKTLVTSDGYLPQYVNSGHVLFLREGDLWAVPFDADSLSITGAEARVLEGVYGQSDIAWGAYSVSDAGRLVYLPGSEVVDDQTFLYWADRLGNRTELPLPAGHYSEPRLSPDEELLALTVFQADGSTDIWIYDFSRGTFGPRTFAGNARNPVWTLDGSRLVYQLTSSLAGGLSRGELWIMNADGTGQAERILDEEAKALSFSAIDEKLIYITGGGAAPIRLNTLTFSDDAWISAPLMNENFNTPAASVSPDGRWIAYASVESGITQIYVRPYPDLDSGKWQISTGELGNREPSWGPNGNELFFLRLDGTLMHTEMTVEGDSFSPGIVEPLITKLEFVILTSPNYFVSNDGERFLHFQATEREFDTGLDQDHTELIVLENFFEELRRLAPPYQQ